MANILRWMAPVAVTAGLVAAGSAIPAQATTSAYGITIGARGSAAGSVKGKIDGYALVTFKATRHDAATISGTVSGATAGNVVTLLARPFRAHTFTPTSQKLTLSTTGTDTYTFAVSPSLATSYRVRVSTGTTVDPTSAIASVYVQAGGRGTKLHTKCGSSSCTTWYTTSTILPASASGNESHKHVYLYLDQWRSANRPGKWYYLSKTARTSKPRHLSAGEFAETFTWHVRVRSGSYWYPIACTKDTVRTDGLGLPGHHGCGDRRVSTKISYLG